MDLHREAYEEALKGLKEVEKSALGEIKAYKSPPKNISTVFSGIAIILGKRDDWPSIQTMLTKENVLQAMVH